MLAKWVRKFFIILNRFIPLRCFYRLQGRIRYVFAIMKACAYFPSCENLTLSSDCEIKLHDNIKLGKNVIIGHRCTLGAYASIEIGDDVTLSKGVIIETAGLDFRKTGSARHIGKPIKIGSRVWIGANAIILGGVTIGDDVIIGAGAIITKDIPAAKIVVSENKQIVFER